MSDTPSGSSDSREDSGKKRLPVVRRLLAALSFAAVAAAVALVLVPAAATKGGSNGLEARVVATNKGPIPPCDVEADPTDCVALVNQVNLYVYVNNDNKFETIDGRYKGFSRATHVNSFVIDSIDDEVWVDGVMIGTGSFTPPPSPNSELPFGDNEKFQRLLWGRWPSTVSCGTSAADYGKPDPCVEVGKPGVMPGESTIAFYIAWVHDDDDLVGTHQFKFTVHGTLNGTQIVLTASSKEIVMT